MFQIEKVSGFVSGFELSILYSYPMRSAFVFVSGLKCGKRWHPDPISSVSDPNPSLDGTSKFSNCTPQFSKFVIFGRKQNYYPLFLNICHCFYLYTQTPVLHFCNANLPTHFYIYLFLKWVKFQSNFLIWST